MKANFQQVVPYLSNPLVLIGFLLLLFFGIHRTLVRSGMLPPVSQTASSRIVRMMLHYGFLIALVVICLGFGMAAFREALRARETEFHERVQAIRSRALTRVEAEELVQNQRGSIERCLTDHQKFTSLNFVFQPQPPGLLNVDVFTEIDPQMRGLGHIYIPFGTYNPQELNEVLKHSRPDGVSEPRPEDIRWMRQMLVGDYTETPATKYKVVGSHAAIVEGLGDKLSISEPDVNRCILNSIGSSVAQYTTTANELPMIHRYITDAGVKKAKAEAGHQRPR